jgi:galactose mutarotase-like enzyme
MTFKLENENISLEIVAKGAELSRVWGKKTHLDYLWSGDANFWGKTSPVLFPIVGGLKNNTYTHEGKTYNLPRHGFARDKVFELETQTPETLVFLLKSDAQTRENYPFEFKLRLKYTLLETGFSLTYSVKNTDEKQNLLFSVGAHPAFRLPLIAQTEYTDYHLKFSDTETLGRFPLDSAGLIETKPDPLFLENTQELALTPALFYSDAVVLKHLKSEEITIGSTKTAHGLRFSFKGFPYFGIWAARDAPFICLEPWCGIADGVNTTQILAEKEGINELAPQKTFERTWAVDIF